MPTLNSITVTDNYTVQPGDDVILVAATGKTITLPALADVAPGQLIEVQIVLTSSSVTVDGGGALIAGTAGIVFSGQFESLTVLAGSTDWTIYTAPASYQRIATVESVAATNRAYDRTTVVTVDGTSATLLGIAEGDTVTVNASTITGALADSSIGTGRAVQVAGVTIGGADAAKYVLRQPVLTVNITAVALTVTGITATNQPYFGTTSATLVTGGATLVGVVSGDTITLDVSTAVGTFATAAVGTGKTVTISGLTVSGAAVGNYTLTQPTTTAVITAAPLTVVGIKASKVYDRTTTATFDLTNIKLVGVVPGDAVTLVTSGIAGAFGAATVGYNLSITVSGLTITGAAAGNYTLTQPTVRANITPCPLTATGVKIATSAVFTAIMQPALDVSTAALVGVIAGDTVTLTSAGAFGHFPVQVIGLHQAVTPVGLTLAGAAAGNYTLTLPTLYTDVTAS